MKIQGFVWLPEIESKTVEGVLNRLLSANEQNNFFLSLDAAQREKDKYLSREGKWTIFPVTISLNKTVKEKI